MPGGKERILRRRIQTVQSTKKITKAMELIAASRIVKAQQRLVAARPYSRRISEMIANLAQRGASLSHPLLTEHTSVNRVGYVVISADRGLSGAYNSNVIRTGERSIIEDKERGREYSLIAVGKKAHSYFSFRNFEIDSFFSGMSEQPSYEDARQVAAKVMVPFNNGEVDQVNLVYTQFLSAGVQRAVSQRLMPIDISAVLETVENVKPHENGPPTAHEAEYEFEPGPEELLNRLFPRYVEARLYAAMLDAAASEHAARQRAMKAATDNARDLITNLKRVMNRARQDSITTEIVEIVGGAEALRQSGSLGEDLLPDHLEYRRSSA